MKILITGATGFIGRNLVLAVLKKGVYDTIWLPVRSLEKLRSQFKEEGFSELPSSIRAFEGDCANWNLGQAAVADHVVHGAGVIFARTKQEYWETNVEGTLRLFRALKSPSKVVVLSSLAAAGPTFGAEPRLETDLEVPLTWYGISKLEMEKRLAAEFASIPYICLRPPMIFGPRDHATLPLFKMIRKPVQFKPGFRSKSFSVLSAEDLSSAILAALGGAFVHPQRSYFVAHTQVITDRDILREAAAASGVPSRVLPVPQWILKMVSRVVDTIPTWRTTIPTLSVDRAKEIWPSRWVISPESFEKDFHWKAKMPFPEAVRATRDWYLKTGQIV